MWPMSAPARSVVVPGNHDGVHIGHQALFAHARTVAAREALEVVALTFDPHPLRELAPDRAPTPLTTIARRVQLLEAAGADRVEIARFDAAYAAQTAEEWVDAQLVRGLAARVLIVGPDFRFGRDRGGDLAQLEELGRARGFVVDVSSEVRLAGTGERVSSTAVRSALMRGDVTHAALLLGRPHLVDGVVVEGHKRGRTIGFPTANLAPDPILLPLDGVYAVRVQLATGAWHDGVANLGTRPTFAAGRSLEAHLFDFDGDLYGARVSLAFIARLRDEQKFDGKDALIAQIRRDADAARALLAHSKENDA
jgi:riboflavin kinase/FMN adenylyltransferase